MIPAKSGEEFLPSGSGEVALARLEEAFMTSAIDTVDNPRPGTGSDASLLGAQDLYLFNQGRHYRAYNKLGAHLDSVDAPGACFSVWARCRGLIRWRFAARRRRCR